MELPEFRLYYNDNGDVLFYTCEKPEGKYIVVDLLTYHACRHDVKIMDGSVVSKSIATYLYKLVQSDEGIQCHKDDVSIVYESSNSIKWQLKYE